jgi:hypothetical protein
LEQLLSEIGFLGETLEDLEKTRIQIRNRIGAAERENLEPMPHLIDIAERVEALEHLAEMELKRAWRKHPLAPWAKSVRGLGEKQIARLIAVIGDPGERPNVDKLRAYCGHGDPARKRRKNMSQEEAMALGNPKAKLRVHLISESFVKAVAWGSRPASPYRIVYDERREKTKDRTHAEVCVRCGPSGKPALPGSPWSDAHKHADALRVVGKTLLKDMWVVARALNRAEEDEEAENAEAARNLGTE